MEFLLCPGGVYKTFNNEEREYFLDGKNIESIDTMIAWSQSMVNFMKEYHEKNRKFLDEFAAFPSGHLGTGK